MAHPYFIAFCAACLRYAVLTMTCARSGTVVSSGSFGASRGGAQT